MVRKRVLLNIIRNRIKLDVLNWLILSLKYGTLEFFFKSDSYASSKVSSLSIWKGLTTIHSFVLSRTLEA